MANIHAPPPRTVLQAVLDDRVLVSAFVVCALLIGYQLIVTLLQPPWIKPATDWLSTTLAWLGLLVVAFGTVHLLHTHQPQAATGCCLALAMLSYAIGRTTWTIADVFIYPHGVPFPSLPDLFFILQYPFFVALLFLSLLLAGGRWLPGVRIIVDGLLWMSAVTALSWYFVLLPLLRQTPEPQLSKFISMCYQIFDLVLFYGLVILLYRTRRTIADWPGAALIGLALLSLFVADTWAALLLLHPPYTYRTGSPPDLFWFITYLLFPLAGLVQLRLPATGLHPPPPIPAARFTWREVLGSIGFVAPSVALVTAGVAIIAHEERTSGPTGTFTAPEAVGIGLLLLAMLRPALFYLEEEQLRRERDAARTEERAWRLTSERMEAFLSMVAHELRTPLTSLIANLKLMGRRLDGRLHPNTSYEDYGHERGVLRAQLERCDQSVERMHQLVEDVLDDTSVQHGRLALQPEPCNLAAVVGEAVAEQMALHPERTILWVADVSPVPVMADANRLEQVVANYLSNALKFSRPNQIVETRLRPEEGMARVSVHDDGVGVAAADQPHIWERFYQAKGAGVQHGSQVGFGLGLHISRAIIEGHHGQVGLESVPGQGTTIWFTLPLASPQASASSEVGTD
jgi:signal transduction histidine kinase